MIVKATELDRVIKNFDPALKIWQRLALASVYVEWVHRVGVENYSVDEFLRDDQYGTLTQRANWEMENNHEFCTPGACLACGAYRAQVTA